MSNIKIFRANRGEGKTKWLVERIKDCAEAGNILYYIGWDESFESVKHLYEATYRERCPLKYRVRVIPDKNNCFFTDELLDNLAVALPYKPEIVGYGYLWYITMSKEDFVN